MNSFTCKTCGKEFQVSKSAYSLRVKRGSEPKFCKRECTRKQYVRQFKRTFQNKTITGLRESLSKKVVSLKEMPPEKQAEMMALYAGEKK